MGIRSGIIKRRRGAVLRCHSIGDRDRCSLFGGAGQMQGGGTAAAGEGETGIMWVWRGGGVECGVWEGGGLEKRSRKQKCGTSKALGRRRQFRTSLEH